MWVNCPICGVQFEHDKERELFSEFKNHLIQDHGYTNRDADTIAKNVMRNKGSA